MALKFDELNTLEDYFKPMAISEDDKARRVELANLLTDAILYFFMVFEVHKDHNSKLEKALYEQLLSDRISESVSKVTGIDGEMSNHIRTLSKEVVETTFKHETETETDQVGHESKLPDPKTHYKVDNDNDISNALTLTYPDESLDPLDMSSDSHVETVDDEDELISKEDDEVEEMMENEAVMDYWISINRARLIAQNEANTFLNYTEYIQAKENGFTQKTWLTMPDNKVRDTHEEVEGKTIGIDEFFQVGNSEMKFPHDWELNPDPKETINCRCAVEYKK